MHALADHGGHAALFIIIILIITFYFPAQQEVSPSATFWTSRAHRRFPFSPPMRAFIFIADGVRHSAFQLFMLVDFQFNRNLLTRALVSRFFRY